MGESEKIKSDIEELEGNEESKLEEKLISDKSVLKEIEDQHESNKMNYGNSDERQTSPDSEDLEESEKIKSDIEELEEKEELKVEESVSERSVLEEAESKHESDRINHGNIDLTETSTGNED